MKLEAHIKVPSFAAGRVIGKGGKTVNEDTDSLIIALAEQTQARIFVFGESQLGMDRPFVPTNEKLRFG